MASTWRVTSQQETTETTPGVGFTRGYRVAFTTGEGNSGSVFVPMDRYTPDNVRLLVASVADRIDSVGSLTSGD